MGNLEFAEGAATPSLGISSVHSSFFDSPSPDGKGSPVAEGDSVEEMQERLCLKAFNSAGSAVSLHSKSVLSSHGQGSDNSPKHMVPGSLDTAESDSASFRRAVELSTQGLGCATKLVTHKQWHRKNFKGVDEVLSARAPAAPWLYQTSVKPPGSGHFMEADYVPLEVSASDHSRRGASARVEEYQARTPSRLQALPKTNLLRKSPLERNQLEVQ